MSNDTTNAPVNQPQPVAPEQTNIIPQPTATPDTTTQVTMNTISIPMLKGYDPTKNNK